MATMASATTPLPSGRTGIGGEQVGQTTKPTPRRQVGFRLDPQQDAEDALRRAHELRWRKAELAGATPTEALEVMHRVQGQLHQLAVRVRPPAAEASWPKGVRSGVTLRTRPGVFSRARLYARPGEDTGPDKSDCMAIESGAPWQGPVAVAAAGPLGRPAWQRAVQVGPPVAEAGWLRARFPRRTAQDAQRRLEPGRLAGSPGYLGCRYGRSLQHLVRDCPQPLAPALAAVMEAPHALTGTVRGRCWTRGCTRRRTASLMAALWRPAARRCEKRTRTPSLKGGATPRQPRQPGRLSRTKRVHRDQHSRHRSARQHGDARWSRRRWRRARRPSACYASSPQPRW